MIEIRQRINPDLIRTAPDAAAKMLGKEAVAQAQRLLAKGDAVESETKEVRQTPTTEDKDQKLVTGTGEKEAPPSNDEE